MKLKLTEENRKWWILAAMTATVSMIFVDITVLPVVLPTLQREMHISDLGLQWIINAYTLVLAVLVLAGGKIGDMWGLKKAFCFGVTSFALASAMCGLSNTESWMIFSRALQGIGGAFLLPATQGIIVSHFPPHQRGKALGLFVSIGSIFLALGPLIGGSLTTYLSWRYVFWINLPIAAIGLMLALYAVPPMRGKKEKFDFRGFSILSVAIASLVFALMQSEAWGWSSPATLILIAVGIFCMIVLFRRKHKPHASILDFNLMRQKSFIASSTCIFNNQLIIMVTVFWAIYFQNILGFSASTAGAYSFMANIPVLFAAPLGGFLVDRLGPRIPVMTGFGLIFFSLSWFCTFANHANIWLLMPTLLTFGFGVSMIFTPCFVSMMNEVSAEKRGVASGITAALRQFSSSLGLALFGTVYSSIYYSHLGNSLQKNPGTAQLQPEQFEGLLSRSPAAVKIMASLPHVDAGYVLQSAQAAFLDAFTRMNLLGAILAAVGVLIGWRMMKNQPISHQK
ncbi:MAG: MFS transporter [Verrucomicrobia bacterium]|nr:MFS transporter [Verrucomicrobiota bacterium]